MRTDKNRKASRKSENIDPVCRMKIDADSANSRIEYAGRTHYFCSPYCHLEFELNPDKFLQE